MVTVGPNSDACNRLRSNARASRSSHARHGVARWRVVALPNVALALRANTTGPRGRRVSPTSLSSDASNTERHLLGNGCMKTRDRLRGSVVVLTGASSGIGRAAALMFAARHTKLVLAARTELRSS